MNEIMRSLHSLYLNVCGHKGGIFYADEYDVSCCLCCYTTDDIDYYYDSINPAIRELERSSVTSVIATRRLFYRSIFRQHRLTSQGHDVRRFLVPQEFEYLLGNQIEDKDERDNEIVA